jgi:hypothetical protein
MKSYDKYVKPMESDPEYAAIVDVAKLCEEFDEAIKERDQAIKERDAYKQSYELMECDCASMQDDIDEINLDRDEYKEAHRQVVLQRQEARYWARKMMAERDEWKKRAVEAECFMCRHLYIRQRCDGCSNKTCGKL